MKGHLSRKRKFIKIVAETGDLLLAQNTVYPSQKLPSQIEKSVENKIADPEVIKGILKIWRKAGITLDLAAKRHLYILTSKNKRVKGADILKAVDMVYRGHGIKEFAKDSDKEDAKSILQIFVDQRRERGLPLPTEIQKEGKDG